MNIIKSSSSRQIEDAINTDTPRRSMGYPTKFTTSSLLPHDEYHSTENLAAQLPCRTSQPTYYSSTPKINNKATHPATVFPSTEVSPEAYYSSAYFSMVPDGNRHQTQEQQLLHAPNINGSVPNNIQNSDIPMESLTTANTYNETFLAQNVTKGCLDRRSLLDVRRIESHSKQSSGIVISPILLHQQELRRIGTNNFTKSHHLPANSLIDCQAGCTNSSSITNTNINQRRLSHESLGCSRFSVFRKAATAKLNYERSGSVNFALPTSNMLSNKVIGRACSQEPILWNEFKRTHTYSNNERKLSSLAYTGVSLGLVIPES